MEKQMELRTNGIHVALAILGGALVGGLVGATAMMLFAPQSGKKTRAKIQQKSIELRELASDTVEDALAQTRHKAHQIKVNADHQTKVIQQRGQAVLDDQKERLSTIVDAGKTAVQSVLS